MITGKILAVILVVSWGIIGYKAFRRWLRECDMRKVRDEISRK